MRSFLKKTVRMTNSVIDTLSVAGMIGTFLLVVINVIGRYVTYLGSLSWSEEGARYLFILVCCFGLIKVTREREHFKVSMLVEKAPPLIGQVFNVIADLIMMALMTVLASGGYQMIFSTLRNKSSALRLPTWILYALLVFSSIGMLLSMVKILIEDICGKRFGEEEKKEAD